MSKKSFLIRLAISIVLSVAVLLAGINPGVTITSEGRVSFSIWSGSVSATPITTLAFHSGFEIGSFDEWEGVVGAPTVNSTVVNTGTYSLRVNPSASQAYALLDIYDETRITFYLYIATAPDAEATILSNNEAGALRLSLTSDRYLKLYHAAAQKGDTGTTQLSVDTWYRISVSLDRDTANDPAKVYINGNEEISADTDGTNYILSYLGTISTVSADLYFDDFAYDKTSSTADLGDIRVLRAMPNDTGQYAQYDQTSGYTYVDDWPNSDASYIEDNQATAVRESYNIEDASSLGIGVSDDIHSINVLIRGNADGGGGTDHMMMVRDNGSDYNSADLAFNGIKWFNWYHNDLPNGGGAWTVARFDALQVGSYHSGVQDQRVMSVLAMVAYTPAADGTPDISNTPGSIAFGVISNSSDNWSNGSAPTFPLDDGECYFTVTNNSSGAVSITIKATNFTGGVGWTLASSPGSNIITMKAGKSGDANEGAMVSMTTSEQAFISGLAASGTKKWEIKLEAPTGVTDGVAKSSTVTLTATLD